MKMDSIEATLNDLLNDDGSNNLNSRHGTSEYQLVYKTSSSGSADSNSDCLEVVTPHHDDEDNDDEVCDYSLADQIEELGESDTFTLIISLLDIIRW